MYPKNAASPEPIAIGAVVQISDGAVQTSGCTVRIKPIGVAEGDGAGTTAYSTDGIVLYTPTQSETNYTSFILIAKKTGCIPVSITVVTTASATPGKVVLSGETHTSAVIPTVSTLTGHTAQTGDNYARLGAPAGASVSADIAAAKTVLDTAAGDVANIDGAAMRGTDSAALASALATAQSDLDVLTGVDGATLATLQGNYAPAVAGNQMDLVNAPNATAVTAIQSGLATSANQTTILNRLGAWTGTGVNTVLGAFKALLSKTASNPSDIGGTFDAAADSTEAIRERGDAAWTGGGGGDTIVVAPIVATTPTQIVTQSGTVQAFRYCALPAGPLVIVDADAAAIDLSASEVKMVCQLETDSSVTFTLVETTHLTIGGAGSNEITIDYVPTVAGKFQRKTFRKPSGGDWQVVELGYWDIQDGPDPDA